MTRFIACGVAAAALALGVSLYGLSQVLHAEEPSAAEITLPPDYRDWKLVSVAQENGQNNDIRAIVGNAIAIEAFRNNVRPFPDGSVIVRLAWRYQSSPRNDAVFPAPQSFVAGPATNVQISVKDSRRFAETAGWGYGQFEGGKPTRTPGLAKACYACHAKLQTLTPGADYVFTDYSH